MIFYHFTAAMFLDQIKAEGLTKGEVPLSARQVINGVWLTTDKSPDGHGLSSGEAISPDERRGLQAKGLLLMSAPENLRWANKREFRITVKIRDSDPALKRWISWGRKRLAPDWYDTLTKVGGGSRKARSWYVCFRVIQPSEFQSIDLLPRCEEPASNV